MKAPTEEILIALNRLSSDSHYPLVVGWLNDLYIEQAEEALNATPDVTTRRAQGAGQAFRHLLRAFETPGMALKKHRAANIKQEFNHDKA
jgi:hypothetical protein